MSTSVRATQTARKAIARRVTKGNGVADSSALLTELTDTLSGDNLAAALVYQDFATARTADAVAAALLPVEEDVAQVSAPEGEDMAQRCSGGVRPCDRDNPWKIGCNGAGARPWFVLRNFGPNGSTCQYSERSDGSLRRFASSQAAQRSANALNTLAAAQVSADPAGDAYAATFTSIYDRERAAGASKADAADAAGLVAARAAVAVLDAAQLSATPPTTASVQPTDVASRRVDHSERTHHMTAPARPVIGHRPAPGADAPTWAVTTSAPPAAAERVATAVGVSAPEAAWTPLPGQRRRWRTGDRGAAVAVSRALRLVGHGAVMRKDPTSPPVQGRPETFKIPVGVREAADRALACGLHLDAAFTVGPGTNRTGAVVAGLSALAAAADVGVILTTPEQRARAPITVSIPLSVPAAATAALLSLPRELAVTFTVPAGTSRSAAITAALRALIEAAAGVSAVKP